MSNKHKYDPPAASLGDHTHTLARAGIGSLPVLGAAATELFKMVIAPPLQRRHAEWMNEVAEGLRNIEARLESDFEMLGENEPFVDSVLQATQAAIRTGQTDKREALRNAVLNCALPNAPDESKQAMFISFVDRQRQSLEAEVNTMPINSLLFLLVTIASPAFVAENAREFSEVSP